jgi:Ca2+-binding RTX toxin-like protein
MISSAAISDVFYNMDSMADGNLVLLSATQASITIGSFTYTLTGVGFTLTNIGGKDYLGSGTIDAIAVNISGSDAYAVTGLSISAGAFRSAIQGEVDNTDVAALEEMFLRQVYTIQGTTSGDFQSVTQLSADGIALLTTKDNLYSLVEGADTVSAGRGKDTIFAGDGDDIIDGGSGGDYLVGGADNDTLSGVRGDDVLDGETGDDVVFGGSGKDSMFGGEDNDSVYGGIGEDQMNGETGDDRLFGGDGGDVMAGDEGLDRLFGGVGNDFLDGGDARDLLSGGIGADTIYGGDGNDVLDGADEVDHLFGGEGNDDAFGGDGADSLYGNDGRDLLDAGTGDDTVFAGGGADTIIGGAGADLMYGDASADRFVFVALSDMGIGVTADYVNDFATGVDTLDFSGLGLTFVGGGPFTGANQLRFDALNTRIEIDSDGDLLADLEIELQTGAVVAAGDLDLV